jgi:FkbM family methyltransferase
MNWRQKVRTVFGDATFLRRMPSGQRIYLAPSSQLRYLRPGHNAFDLTLLGWADGLVKEGMTVWDIGANVGCFAFQAAARGARVLAVEPDPFLSNLLVKSKRKNPLLQLEVVAAAVSDQFGFAGLKLSDAGRASNTLDTCGDVQVPTVTLDDLLDQFGKPDLIKIDVEGYEPQVLRGGPRVIATKPVILLEAWPTKSDEITSLLKGATLRDIGQVDWPTVDRATFNTLAEWPA